MKNKIAFALLGLMSLGLAGCGTTIGVYADADKYVAGNTEYANVEVTKIDVDWVSGSVTLVEDETATGITISEVTNLTDQNDLVHSYFHDGILSVKYFASGHWCRSLQIKKELTITYKPGLDSLRVELTSGSLTADNIHAKDFNLDITSGSANVGNIVADNIDVDMTSGSATFTKVNAKSFNADLTSGKITVGYEAIERASFDLTSGKINMTLPTDGGTVKVSKTSGSVVANRAGTFSGNTYKFGEGAADIKVSMTSGTLTID